ncbi:MAG TPA: Fe-S cluster assembly protein SufD [Kiloniellales bacterium]|nr:Fe-S cluster assembly protein SufD [Kiloniellales bacterium]
MTTEVLAVDEIEQRWKAAAPALPGAGVGWLEELRAEGLAQYREAGLPIPKLETWKYSNLPRVLRDRRYVPSDGAEPAEGAALLSLLPEGSKRLRLAFLDGRFSPEHSDLAALPAGVTLAPLSQLLRQQPEELEGLLSRPVKDRELSLRALNAALFDEGVALIVAPGTLVEPPVELLFLGGCSTQPVESHLRLVVQLGRGAQAQLIEHHQASGDGAGLLNLVSDLHLEQNASLTHLRLQEAGAEAVHLAGSSIRLERDARYRSLAFTSGALFSRHEIGVALVGENAEVELNGTYLLRGRQHGDTTSVIRHCVPHTRATQTYKGALDDRARAVFQGCIAVEREAQKTDGRMLNQTLLLSDKAEIDSKPELEIFADDVQCAHGATAGDLDKNALFYLRSRGLNSEQATALLVEAFVAELIEEFPMEALRPALSERLRHWLAGGA